METVEESQERAARLSDEQLTQALDAAAHRERESLVDLLVFLGEFESRDLPEKKGYLSAFEYCVRKLGTSRAGAYRRVAVARKGKKFPSLLSMIARKELHLMGAAMLAKHLTSENHQRILQRVSGKSEEEIEKIVAGLAPKERPRDRARVISAPKPLVEAQAPAPTGPDLVLSAESAPQPAAAPAKTLIEVRMVLEEETFRLLKRATELMMHKNPRADYDPVVKEALERLLERIDRDRKAAKPTRPEKDEPADAEPSRYVPEAVRQDVWEQDGGRCSYVGPDGVRCASRAWLEFDHKTPFALGGSSRDRGNIGLMCRPHNQLKGRLAFGGAAPPS